jgi:hypothetical protein
MDLNKTLAYVDKKGRKLDFYLILNLISDKSYDEEIIDELLKYQNADGGFGHGLEPDASTPSSSVLASDIAIEVLNEVSSPEKNAIIKKLVQYLISQYNEECKSFEFVSKDVEEYPCAIWWTGDTNENFDYFNPTPEVVGFLYKNRQYIEDFDIEALVDYVIEKIISDFPKAKSDHSLFSVYKFYQSIDIERKNKIKKMIVEKTKELICTDKEEWQNYAPQPYKLITSKEHPLYREYKNALEDNLQFLVESMDENGIWMPEWSWGQYEELFSKEICFQWMGFLTFQRLKVLLEFGFIKKD